MQVVTLENIVVEAVTGVPIRGRRTFQREAILLHEHMSDERLLE